MNWLQLGYQIASIKRDIEEELQATDGRVQGRSDSGVPWNDLLGRAWTTLVYDNSMSRQMPLCLFGAAFYQQPNYR